jgi:formylglycine-generating enzyme required for sulfatase activity
MNTPKALPVLSILVMAIVLPGGVGSAAPPAAGTPATTPAAPAASRPSSTPSTSSGQAQPAYPLWDGNETVAAYARRAGIKDVQVTLALGGNVTMKLTLIPAGKFMMGGPAEANDKPRTTDPHHEVTISRPFYMGACTVTQEQYEKVIGKNPSDWKGAQSPVEMVMYNDALAFCTKVSKPGKAVRLPTEAQWEYACRAGSTTRRYYGDDPGDTQLVEYAWCATNSDGAGTHSVGQKKPNAWGLYDMYGNVFQLCSDWSAPYEGKAQTDPAGPATGAQRVMRGGSWVIMPQLYASAWRRSCSPETASHYIGFRVVMELN